MTEVTSEPRVYMRHMRSAQLCREGVEEWWKAHGLDFRDFARNGIAGERLVETGDPLALRAVIAARTERDGR